MFDVSRAVGDWEHTMIRFKHGEPQAIHLSAHSDGHSYKLTWCDPLFYMICGV